MAGHPPWPHLKQILQTCLIGKTAALWLHSPTWGSCWCLVKTAEVIDCKHCSKQETKIWFLKGASILREKIAVFSHLVLCRKRNVADLSTGDKVGLEDKMPKQIDYSGVLELPLQGCIKATQNQVQPQHYECISKFKNHWKCWDFYDRRASAKINNWHEDGEFKRVLKRIKIPNWNQYFVSMTTVSCIS